ncbi:integrase_H2C2 domain-containing protein [Trichonephila clavipes]|nr:integrase_H2C2 domain-containing protein [Trichonephila clavipes]
MLRWCNTAPASGPIREIILDKAKSPALGFLGEKVLNKNGTHPNLDKEPIPELKFFKAYHRLSENFFWQNMYKDTKNFVRSCTICLSRKNAFKIPPAPFQPVEQSQEPGETCHIDIFGALKTTPKGIIVMFSP